VTVVVLLCEIEKTAVEVEPWLSLLTTPSELRTREENEGGSRGGPPRFSRPPPSSSLRLSFHLPPDRSPPFGPARSLYALIQASLKAPTSPSSPSPPSPNQAIPSLFLSLLEPPPHHHLSLSPSAPKLDRQDSPLQPPSHHEERSQCESEKSYGDEGSVTEHDLEDPNGRVKKRPRGKARAGGSKDVAVTKRKEAVRGQFLFDTYIGRGMRLKLKLQERRALPLRIEESKLSGVGLKDRCHLEPGARAVDR